MNRPLRGSLVMPGDKSIGHRALLMGALCDGPVRITGLGDGDDNRHTAAALTQLGVTIEHHEDHVLVHGVGLRGLRAPREAIDCGNSGTTMRLLLGVLAGQPFEATLVGDASLSKRPMKRVLDPLSRMGLELLSAREGTYAPVTVRGKSRLKALSYRSPVASAQVKSALMLAGLYADGPTEVTEPAQSRDHTERMLAYLGRPPKARALHVPGDLSSAAFMLAAALLVPGSEVTISDVGVNPSRMGFVDVLSAMGAKLSVGEIIERNGEAQADLSLRYGALRGISIGGELSLRSIDELPLIATLAARAHGTTHIRDAAELRVKESDRIARTTAMLRSFGIAVREHDDGLSVEGRPDEPLVAGQVDARGDHRIAMCGCLLAMIAPPGTELVGAEAIATSFPSFTACLQSLGAKLPFEV